MFMRYFQINNKIIDEKIKQFFETCFLQFHNYSLSEKDLSKATMKLELYMKNVLNC